MVFLIEKKGEGTMKQTPQNRFVDVCSFLQWLVVKLAHCRRIKKRSSQELNSNSRLMMIMVAD